eukprot:4285915-Pleurochrysis_carterae.AAC.3
MGSVNYWHYPQQSFAAPSNSSRRHQKYTCRHTCLRTLIRKIGEWPSAMRRRRRMERIFEDRTR